MGAHLLMIFMETGDDAWMKCMETKSYEDEAGVTE